MTRLSDSKPSQEEKTQLINIGSPEHFETLTTEITQLPDEKLLAQFDPYQMTRHLRRNCEIYYYVALSEAITSRDLHEKKTLSPAKKAVLLLFLAFMNMQIGANDKALVFLNQANVLR